MHTYSDTCLYFFRYSTCFIFCSQKHWPNELVPHCWQNKNNLTWSQKALSGPWKNQGLLEQYLLPGNFKRVLFVCICVIRYVSNATGTGKAKYGLPGRWWTSYVVSKKLPSDDYYGVLLATQGFFSAYSNTGSTSIPTHWFPNLSV